MSDMIKFILRLALLLVTTMILLVVCMMYTSVPDDEVKIPFSTRKMVLNKDTKLQNVTKHTNISIRKWKTQLYKQTTRNKDTLYSNIPHKFLPLLSSDQYGLMLEIWDKFTDICQQNNIAYVLYGGSLLGSYRHHGMVPWDDDIDVIMKMDDVTKLQEVVLKIKEFEIYPDLRTYKFFKVYGQSLINHRGFNWPFVDIFSYKQNQTHLWDDGWYPEFIIWEKSRYFPLTYRPYENGLHPVPNDIVYGLEQEGKYDINNICISHNYDHKLDKEYDRSVVEAIHCKTLYPFYPFVKRIYTDNHIDERLIVNGTVLNRFIY